MEKKTTTDFKYFMRETKKREREFLMMNCSVSKYQANTKSISNNEKNIYVNGLTKQKEK